MVMRGHKTVINTKYIVVYVTLSSINSLFLPKSMISNFLRSTRNLSSVHSGSGSGWGPLRSSSEPGSGESVLRSLLEPWSDCCKYPLKVSHWAAIGAAQQLLQRPLQDFRQSSGRAGAKRRAPVNFRLRRRDFWGGGGGRERVSFQSRHFAVLCKLMAARWRCFSSL